MEEMRANEEGSDEDDQQEFESEPEDHEDVHDELDHPKRPPFGDDEFQQGKSDPQV
jgi:hypothetical protein